MSINIFIGIRWCIASAVVALWSSAHAQPSAQPLGLTRLRAETTPTVPSVLTADKFAVADLTPASSGGANTKKDGVDFIAIGAQREWTSPLRGSSKDVVFVSFSAYASLSTIIRVGDAWLGIIVSPGKNYAQIMSGAPGKTGVDWVPLGYHVRMNNFSGKTLAVLPALTVRIDPSANVWDLFAGSRLIANDLPFYRGSGADSTRQFDLKAGQAGAWLLGLVMSDENPLYEDANNNGIDDRFEKQQRGSLLGSSSSAIDRKTLAESWITYIRTHPTSALAATRISPDR